MTVLDELQSSISAPGEVTDDMKRVAADAMRQAREGFVTRHGNREESIAPAPVATPPQPSVDAQVEQIKREAGL